MVKSMRFKMCYVLTIIFLFLSSITVSAAEKYVRDDAGVLNSSTVNTVNTNLNKLENNTKAKVRIVIIKSLEGKNMNDYANSIGKETNTDKFAVFVVSVADHKNKFLAGSGLNNVFTQQESDKIASIPNEYFKKNDFNTGILKVGQVIDQDITTKAIKTKQVEVVNDGLKTTVQPKKSHAGLVMFFIILALVIIIFIYKAKKKANKQVEDFARRNGLDYSSTDSGAYRSTKVSPGTSANSSTSNSFNNSAASNHNYSCNERTPNNTTVINNHVYDSGYNNSGFVEGMILGQMLEHHHEERYDNNRNNYSTASEANYSNSSSYEDDDTDKKTSGDWGLSSGDSDWGSSDTGSSDSGSSSWDSDCSGGSDW